MKKSTIYLVVALVAIIAAASFGYDNLQKKEAAANQEAQINMAKEAEPKMASTDEKQSEPATKPRIASPNFIVFDKAGEQVSFENIAGKPAVLNFWASWCSFCKVEMPDFQKVYDKYKDENITFMMIDGTDGKRETRESADKLFEENAYTMPIYYDEALMGRDGLDIMVSANAAFRISGYPSTVFIDSEGYVSGIYTGALDEARLTKLVDFMLDESNNGKSLEEALK